MNKILLVLAFLSGTAFAQQDKLFENRSLNKDLNLKVNIGATQTTLIQMEGANGATRIIVPDGAQTLVKSTDAAGAIFRDASGAAVISTWIGLKSNGGGASEIQSYVNTGEDTGTNPSLTFDTRVVDGAGSQSALATRPAFGWANNGTSFGTMSAIGAWTWGPSAALQGAYNFSRGAIVVDRDGTLSTSASGTVAAANQLDLGANEYRNGTNTIAILTGTGYARAIVTRPTLSTDPAFRVFSNYQDAQTAGSATVTTNERIPFIVSGVGKVTIGETGGSQTHIANGIVQVITNGSSAIGSPGGNTTAIFQNNDTTGRTNNVYIIGGTAGGAVLAFGDSGTPSKGSIAFSNSASSNTGAFTISNNMVFNGDGSAAKYFQFQGAGSSSLASTDNTVSKNFSLLVPASGAGATVYTLLGMMSVIMQASYTDTGIVMRLGGTNHQIRATFWLSSEGFNGPGETQPNIFSLAWATPTTVTNVSAATANFHSISDADFRWVNPGTSTLCNTTTCSLQCKLNGGPATAITLSGIVIVNAG